MTAALRCFSVLREGNGKKLNEQYNAMFQLYHGHESQSIPGNLKLLCDASYCFKNIYDAKTKPTTDKNCSSNSEGTTKYVLKSILARGMKRSFVAGDDISVTDLEKKSRSSPELIVGRALLETAKRGIKHYRKALAYASRKFDLDTMQCKESGTTIDDVIEYVLFQMYQDENKKSNNDLNQTIELDRDFEDEIISSTDNHSALNNTNAENSNNDRTSSEDNSSIAIENSNEKSMHNEIDTTIVPDDWFFPSFFSFICFGPFVEKENRLTLLEITDADKNVGKSRASKRKANNIEKELKRESDAQNKRGFSTDQELKLEIINLQKRKEEDRSRETILVGLSIQESAIDRQIQHAEKRAIRLSPDDETTRNSIHWKRVDLLIEKQNEVMKRISDINEEGMRAQKLP